MPRRAINKRSETVYCGVMGVGEPPVVCWRRRNRLREWIGRRRGRRAGLRAAALALAFGSAAPRFCCGGCEGARSALASAARSRLHGLTESMPF